MEQTVWHEALADPPEASWATQIPLLREEVKKLTENMAELEKEEEEAEQQLHSLKYAVELTKSEVARRRRSNNELQSAYESEQPPQNNSSDKQVQSLEAELLNAKRDAANLVYEIERLEFRLKRAREIQTHDASAYRERVAPRSPTTSPRVSLSAGALTSPAPRPLRLIGDVDALVRVKADADKDEGSVDDFEMCRLGVSAGGHIAVYSYANAQPIAYLEEQELKVQGLDEEDREAIRKGMSSVPVRIGEEGYSLCGLREAVLSCKQLIERS
ncbi:hypothetical protein BWQ96_10025 [Gracilariopsis chorda]|uniref:Uncharacterized protein n=1 Tax=Gracilariopsis chorda TaxID=448386 RepID=A0A2V3IDW2_9FLOR|nr:hypothetical protein BWQ96_10025 [Gracilariopsis chorda]|eukprot:PXF40263.1 hypothetical protein BWQ96_10025 [Gracilariopsis chorda]